MFRTFAVAAILVVLGVGSVARAADAHGAGGTFDTTENGFLCDGPVHHHYDSPGDEYFFFDVFVEMPIIDDGDAGFVPGGRRVVDNGEPGFTASIIDLLDMVWLDIDR